MADDARISTALPRHPKTVKLQRRLGAPGCWSLVCLFLWVADSRPEGDLEGMTAEDIEIAANWPGPSGDFVRTLAEVRFLDGREGTYKIHDWTEHNPWAANRPKRRAAARAAAGARWKNGKAAVEADADRMQAVCDPHETAMPTSPHLTTPPDTTSEAPPPVKEPVFALEENARAREAREKPKLRQEDADQRDLRELHKAREKLELKITNGWGEGLTDDEIFVIQCEMAGLPVKKALEAMERGRKWPETLEASA